MAVIIAGYLELWYFVLCLVIFLQCRYFIFDVDILHNFFCLLCIIFSFYMYCLLTALWY